MNRFTDAATIAGARKTDDGYLIAEAFAVRTGIQTYLGTEVGLMDRETVSVYRPESEVRSPESLRTFSHAPITLGHPDQVTADNWKDLAKGEVSTEAQWDGDKIKLPLIVKDAEAIKAIEGGTRELSAGYTCVLDWTPGRTDDGRPYDAIQRNITVNHLAIVPKGRAGSECRIGDGSTEWGASPIIDAEMKEAKMADKLRNIMVDGLTVETTDAGAQAIEKLNGEIKAKDQAIADANDAHAEAIKTKDEEIGRLKGELKKAKDAQPDPAQLDQMVADRAALVTTVAKIAKDVKPEGLSDADLRKAAVAAKMGDAAISGASDAEISGMFKVIAVDAGKADPIADALKGAPTKATDLDAAYAQRNAALQDAWKNPVKKEA